ncbi:alpha/beta fold hydrolase [Marinilactibacillus psychrotolerans]
MINWYRANLKFFASAKVTDQITVPTYVIWGMKDQFLSWKLAEKSLEFCDQGQGTLLGESTHWLHHEKPEQISHLITNFISAI